MRLQSIGRVGNMIAMSQLILRRTTVAALLCACVLGVVSRPAAARVFIGVGIPFFGPGYYGPPPVYYPPPPLYYAPPPVVYAPPQTYVPGRPTASGQACFAGAYSCPMDHPVPAGEGCYCLGNGGQRMWGRAN
jgi:hypothetical protein